MENAVRLPTPYESLSLKSDQLPDRSIAKLDEEIRHLQRRCIMPSNLLELDFQTEPSFMQALQFHGNHHQIVFSHFPQKAEMASLGIRSIKPVYLGGKIKNLAYIHHLRIHPDKRGSSLLAKGYQAFRKVSQQLPADSTLTSILEENAPARKILENSDGRGPLPIYRPICRYLTALIPLKGPGSRWPLKKRGQRADFLVRGLERHDSNDLFSLFRRFGEANDGAPVLDEEAMGKGIWQGLSVENFVGAFRQNRLIGALGVWEQTQWKQILLNRTHWLIGFLRELWNLGSGVWGACPLPEDGKIVPNVLFDPWAIESGFERVLPLLFSRAIEKARFTTAIFAAWGAPEKHPATAGVRHVHFIPYWSNIFQVIWSETPVFSFSENRPMLFHLSSL